MINYFDYDIFIKVYIEDELINDIIKDFDKKILMKKKSIDEYYRFYGNCLYTESPWRKPIKRSPLNPLRFIPFIIVKSEEYSCNKKIKKYEERQKELCIMEKNISKNKIDLFDILPQKIIDDINKYIEKKVVKSKNGVFILTFWKDFIKIIIYKCDKIENNDTFTKYKYSYVNGAFNIV